MCDITVTISCNEIIAVTTNDRRAVIKGSVVMTRSDTFPCPEFKVYINPAPYWNITIYFTHLNSC